MRKLAPVLVPAILLAAFGTPTAWACSQACGYGTYPWGEPFAVCLTVPSDDAHQICIEINSKDRDCECAVHECFLFNPCRDGYPVS